ncbi:MAG: hypothetical protein QXK12_02755 [Candidatus Nezhaarchaeales archaeon]
MVMVRRHKGIFKGRSITFTDGEGNMEYAIPVPDEIVLCDGFQ